MRNGTQKVQICCYCIQHSIGTVYKTLRFVSQSSSFSISPTPLPPRNEYPSPFPHFNNNNKKIHSFCVSPLLSSPPPLLFSPLPLSIHSPTHPINTHLTTTDLHNTCLPYTCTYTYPQSLKPHSPHKLIQQTTYLLLRSFPPPKVPNRHFLQDSVILLKDLPTYLTTGSRHEV